VASLPNNPPSPSTDQAIANAQAAAASVSLAIEEGHEVLDSVMGSESAHII
jgi:hypothetical protein